MSARIRTVNLDQFAECLKGLSRLLIDAVNSGASVGFWAPMDEHHAVLYWREVMQGMVHESRVLIVAEEAGEVVGSVQLVLSERQDGHHRAEITMLMVHTSKRGHGLGRALLAAAHVEARFRGRTLLVLNTRTGDAGERLYESMGYTRAGDIPRHTIGPNGARQGTTIFFHELP